MENWSDICLRWAKNLNLCHVNDIISLADGKFFYEFLLRFLKRQPAQDTTSQTFKEIKHLFAEEFPNVDLVDVASAAQGSEDELLKLTTLLIYLGTNEKYEKGASLVQMSQDLSIFSREVQYRIKCVFKAMTEQRAMLSSSMVMEMMMSRVSETTGSLIAPVSRVRLGSSQFTRLKKASPGSPVIFSYSPDQTCSSPGKEGLDSPVSSLTNQLQSMLEDRAASIRELKTALDGERSEKQCISMELEHLMNEKSKLEQEIQLMKEQRREEQNKGDINNSMNMESELRDKFHQVLHDKRRLEDDLFTVEKRMDEVTQEKERIERRCNYLDSDLSKTRTEKHSFETTIEDMSVKLSVTQTHNIELKKNLEELQGELDVIRQQSLSSISFQSSRASMAPINFHKCDMTNVSIDADDSMALGGQTSPTQCNSNSMLGCSGENMGDFIIPQLQERIDILEGEVENEKLAKLEMQTAIDKLKVQEEELSLQLQSVTESYNKTEEMCKKVGEEKDTISTLLQSEKTAKDDLVDKLSAEIKAKTELEANLDIERSENINLKEKIEKISEVLSVKDNSLAELNSVKGNLEQKINELQVQVKETETINSEIFSAKETLEKSLNQKTGELNKAILEVENFQQKVVQLSGQHDERSVELIETSEKLQDKITELNSKNESLKNLEQKYEELSNEKSVLETQHLQKVRELEIERDNLLSISEGKTKFVEELEASLAAQLATIADLQATISSLTAEKESIQAELTRIELDKQEEMVKSSEKQVALEQEIESLKEKLSSGEKSFENICNSMKNTENVLQEEKNVARELREKYQELEQIKIANDQVLKTRDESIKYKDEEINTLLQEKSDLTQLLQQEKDEVATRLNELSRCGDEIGQLKVTVSEQKSDIETMKAELDSWKDSCQTKDKQLQTNENEHSVIVSNLQKALDEKINELKMKESEHLTLVAQAEELGKSIERIEIDLDAEILEKSKLNDQMLQLKNSHEEQLAVKEQEKERLVSEVQESKSIKENIEVEAQKEKENFLISLSRVEEEKRHLLEQNRELEEKIKTETDQLQMYKTKVEESEERNMLTIKELKQNIEQIKEEKANECEILTKQLEQTKQILHEDKENSERQNHIWEEEIEKMKKEDLRTKENFKEEIELIRSQLKQSEEQNAEKDGTEKILVETRAQLFEIQEAKHKVDSEVKELNTEINAYAEKLRLTRESEDKFSQEVAALKNKLALMAAECEEHCLDRDNMRKLLSDQDKKYQGISIRVETLSQESSEMKQRAVDLEQRLTEKENELLEEREKTEEENRMMLASLEKIESSRQDLEIEKSKLQENLLEIKASTDLKTKEVTDLIEQNKKLEEKLSKLELLKDGESTESNHKLEFLQAHLEDVESEKEVVKSELESVKSALSVAEENIITMKKEMEKETLAIVQLKKDLEEKDNEALKVFQQMGELQEDRRKLADEKEKLQLKLDCYTEEKSKKDIDVESVKKQVTEQNAVLQERVDKINILSTEVEQLKEAKVEIEEAVEKVKEEKTILESKLAEENRTKEGLAGNLAQLITNMNEMKEQTLVQQSKLKDKEKQIKDLEEELNRLMKQKTDTENDDQEMDHLKELINSYKDQVSGLEKDLAKSEVMVTDLRDSRDVEIQEALDDQKQRYEARLKKIQTDMTKDANQKVKTKVTEKTKEKDEKISSLEEEIKGLNQKLENRVSKLDSVYKEEVELYRSKYQEAQESLQKISSKYEAAKDIIKNQRTEKENLSLELNETRTRLSSNDFGSIKRELEQTKAENRRLTVQNNLAEKKLQEYNRRESSVDLSTSRMSSVRPGRATRQSTSNLPEDEENIFKLPSHANTPGRSKAGRTVSDTRMGGRRTRPPNGIGSIFKCDDESGEVFSNSYLMDLQDGRCDVTTNESRMSEFSRRNTLCLPHLKSTYPVEFQFCEDSDITEDAVRNSKVKLGRKTDILPPASPSMPSPVSNLSQRASNLSLDSPAGNTRGNARKPVPKPVAFTVDAPKPGRVERRAIKQPCQGDHGAGKKECTAAHVVQERKPKLEESVDLSPDYQRLARKRKSDQMSRPDPELIKAEEIDEKPDSEDSETSSLSRDSVRGSKRFRKEAGNVSYSKPGPPTPRNKSLNKSKLDVSSTSVESGPLEATPNISRASTRSAKSLKTPLMDSTNTPKTKSLMSKVTPRIKNTINSWTFKSRRKYNLMKQNTGDGLTSTTRTPLKSKDKTPRVSKRK